MNNTNKIRLLSKADFVWLPLLGERSQTATGRRFGKAKSSTQGVEGEGYAPTRNDYVAGRAAKREPATACVASIGGRTAHFTWAGALEYLKVLPRFAR